MIFMTKKSIVLFIILFLVVSCSTRRKYRVTGNFVVDQISKHASNFGLCYREILYSYQEPFVSAFTLRYRFTEDGKNIDYELLVKNGRRDPDYLECLNKAASEIQFPKNICTFYEKGCAGKNQLIVGRSFTFFPRL